MQICTSTPKHNLKLLDLRLIYLSIKPRPGLWEAGNIWIFGRRLC